jgi:hypothetical protein
MRNSFRLTHLLSNLSYSFVSANGQASKIEVSSLMASFTIPEILYTESSPVVVASRTALRASLCMMHQRLRRCDLPGLLHPGSDVVAIITTQSLTRVMPGVAEIHFVSIGPCVSPRITTCAVASRA